MADRASPNRLIWTGSSGTPSEWATAVGGRTVSSVADIDPDAIVVGGETGTDGNFSYPPNQNTWCIPKSPYRIHHPIVFSDLIPLDLSGHFVTCGYPGSGNGIVQTILEAILATDATRRPTDGTTALVAAYAAHYWQQMDVLMGQFGSTLNATARQTATHGETTVSVVWSRAKDRYALFGLPIRNYLYERVHKSHEHFGRKLSMMCNAGAKCLLAIRHPLDTIVSVANKMIGGGIDLLAAEWLFRLVGRGLVQYYRSFLPAIERGHIKPVRFEDCQSSFEQVAEFLASQCDVELIHERITELKRRLLNQSIAPKGHLWQPDKNGKWRQYLGRHHLGILEEEGMSEITNRLGYAMPSLNEASRRPQLLSVLEPGSAVRFRAGLLLHCCANAHDNLDEFCRLGLVHGNLGEGLFFMSNDPNAWEFFESFIQKSEFVKLVNAGIISRHASFVSGLNSR
ncbi:MAG: hypothetical protein WC530_00150 [Candidatus Omnitrophota bacterium]